jgi:putative membrane protein
LLVINALVLMLVAALVKGFRISGFWTALLASLFISVVSTVIGAVVSQDDPGQEIRMPTQGSGVWL